MSTPTEPNPAELNREIAQLETEAAHLEVDRTALAKAVVRLTRRGRYLRLAKQFRAPTASFAAYPLAVFAIGPLVLGVIALVLVNMLLSSWSLALAGFLVAAAAGFATFASLLYRPADAILPTDIAETAAQLGVESSRLHESVSAATELSKRLATLHQHRRELAKTDKLQRAMLLQRDWKSLRGSEWEDYVVEICRTLGANVQRADNPVAVSASPNAPATGPRGVIRRAPTTLFVTFSPRRLAVAAVSEVNPFHAAAVRQVIDNLAQKGCDELGIVTNARLTAGSKQYAHSRRCTLVGADEFPDFVLGRIVL
jgi:hypothetical protein